MTMPELKDQDVELKREIVAVEQIRLNLREPLGLEEVARYFSSLLQSYLKKHSLDSHVSISGCSSSPDLALLVEKTRCWYRVSGTGTTYTLTSIYGNNPSLSDLERFIDSQNGVGYKRNGSIFHT